MYGRIMGTTVKNPSIRARGGWDPYAQCRHCEKWYTHHGIGRHWDKCPKNPKRKMVREPDPRTL